MFNVKFLLVGIVFVISTFLAPASYAVNYEDCGEKCYEESSSKHPAVSVEVQHETARVEEESKSVPWYTYYFNSTKAFTEPVWKPLTTLVTSLWDATGHILSAAKDIVLTGAEATKQVAGLAGWLAWTLKWIIILLPWALLIGAGVALYFGAFGAFATVVGRAFVGIGRGIMVFFSLFGRRGP